MPRRRVYFLSLASPAKGGPAPGRLSFASYAQGLFFSLSPGGREPALSLSKGLG